MIIPGPDALGMYSVLNAMIMLSTPGDPLKRIVALSKIEFVILPATPPTMKSSATTTATTLGSEPLINTESASSDPLPRMYRGPYPVSE